MSSTQKYIELPNFQSVLDAVECLQLSLSAAELHGIMSGFLAAGAMDQGNNYLRALMTKDMSEADRASLSVLFELYAATHQQISGLGFEFQLLLPEETESLREKAEAFTDWCEGFTQGLRMAGVDVNQIEDEDVQEAIQYLTEFADLDYQSIQCSEDDEHAFVEISEYTRMAVLHIHSDLQALRSDKDGSETAH